MPIPSEELLFADALSSFSNAQFVIVGVPFDGTCSFRRGAKFGPRSIREESYNFETYILNMNVDLEDIAIHDSGDLDCETLAEMSTNVSGKMKELINRKKFPIFIGGEHSLTPPAVKGIGKVGVVIIDAHLDFREEYLGERHGHTCVARRVGEIVGMENLVVVGVRSMSREEKRESERLGLNYYDMSKVNSLGMQKILSEVDFDKIYLSLDMDGLDPSYAPGVGNPEFFGLAPQDIGICIKKLRTKLVGFDVTEVNPIYDSGNTSSLTARFIRDVIANVWSVKVQDQ